MSDVAVEMTGLGHFYRPDRWVVRQFTAGVRRGTVFAVLGPNGCGKTTLLHLILGALKPREGLVRVDGRLAFVPQLFSVAFDFTVLDMVVMGRARRIGLFAQPSRADEAAAHAALDRFGLADRAGSRFAELSGGQRQLAIFARALVSDADILVLDEPTSALDLKNQSLVLDRIAALARRDGLTIILTTHHPHHAAAVAHAAALMTGPGQYEVGAVDDVLTEDNLTTLYGVPIRRFTCDIDGERAATLGPVFAAR